MTPRGLEDHAGVGLCKLDDERAARSEAAIAGEQFPSYYYVGFEDTEFELDLLAFSSSQCWYLMSSGADVDQSG